MPTADLMTLLAPKNIIIFILIMTRISGLLMFAPVFSTFPVPVNVKLLLSALVAFLIFPTIIAKDLVIPVDMVAMTIFLLKEFAIGALVGFLANLIFVACQIGAEMLSIQSGLSFSNIMDPTTGTSTSSLSQLYIIPMSLIFLGTNAHDVLFMTVCQSFVTIKPGFDMFFTADFVGQVVHLVNHIFIIALGIVFPVFGVLFVLEVLLGFVSKMMPKMNVFMLALPLKIYITFFLMLAFLTPTCRYLAELINTQFVTIMRMFTGG